MINKIHCCFLIHELLESKKPLAFNVPFSCSIHFVVIQKYFRLFSASNNLYLFLDRNNKRDCISFSSFVKKSFHIFGPL